MRLYGLFDDLSLWVLFVATVSILSLSYEGGFRAGRWRSQRQNHELEPVVRSMVTAMLSLLTFILAFTFWIAASHFDAARQSLLNEVNAIRTVYLRADLFPDPHRTEIRNLLREYVDVRVEGVRTGKIRQAVLRSEELHGQLWSHAIAAKEKTSSPIFAGYFIQSLNEMIALHTRRVTVGLDFRIPNTIWFVLFVIAVLAVTAVGSHGGLTRARRPLVVSAFVLIFSVAMLLIMDLDRPWWGLLKISRQAMIDLQNSMNVH
jgi:hypothetical protein